MQFVKTIILHFFFLLSDEERIDASCIYSLSMLIKTGITASSRGPGVCAGNSPDGNLLYSRDPTVKACCILHRSHGTYCAAIRPSRQRIILALSWRRGGGGWVWLCQNWLSNITSAQIPSLMMCTCYFLSCDLCGRELMSQEKLKHVIIGGTFISSFNI